MKKINHNKTEIRSFIINFIKINMLYNLNIPN